MRHPQASPAYRWLTVGQAAPLDLPRVRLVLQALGQALLDLSGLEGYEWPGYTFRLYTGLQAGYWWQDVWQDPFVWAFVQLEESPGVELNYLSSSSVVRYLTSAGPSMEDVILTTLAQAQDAVEQANQYITQTSAAGELPDFVDVVNDVGPDSFAGALELLLLGVSL